ncbi:MAG TPA: hypothetical protein VK196_22280 [Magnetospirillum sp.]|nr:hypothetical protein [Magnetospirillum sp.]
MIRYISQPPAYPTYLPCMFGFGSVEWAKGFKLGPWFVGTLYVLNGYGMREKQFTIARFVEVDEEV